MPLHLARRRLASQRLASGTAAASPLEAVTAVVGVQAQDVRASTLAIRARVPGADRASILTDPRLVRTWTVRGTAHLIAADDLPWIHTLTAPRNVAFYDGLMTKRGNRDLVSALLPDALSILDLYGPLTKADILSRLATRGHPPLDQSSSNILMPWIASSGRIIGLPDGRFRVADPPDRVDEDEALATLGRRYLAGYGPAGAHDLARWSGFTLGTARRALDAADPLETFRDDLLALPGTLAGDPPEPPPARLLAPFDTAMLGWRTREPIVAAVDDRQVLPGGGIVRAVLLNRVRACATWRVAGTGPRRTFALEPFRRLPARAAIAAEAADVGRFLGVDLQLAS